MKEEFIENAIKDSVGKLVSANVENAIEEKIKEFREELEYNKDRYIAEVMKGIRIYQEQEIGTRTMNYKIIFENVTILKKED
jgi:hypothetical protein